MLVNFSSQLLTLFQVCKVLLTLSRERSLNKKIFLYGKNNPWLIHSHVSKDWSNLKELHIENGGSGMAFLKHASYSARNLKKLTITGYLSMSGLLNRVIFGFDFKNLQELHLNNVQLSIGQVFFLMRTRY